jgi:hypothetical protein
MEVSILLAVVLLLCSVLLRWEPGYSIAIVILIVALLFPVVFIPLSWLWFSFAGLLQKLFSGIILVIVFYIVVLPIALFRKHILKDDFLKLNDFKRSRKSVFTDRGLKYESKDLEKQF